MGEVPGGVHEGVIGWGHDLRVEDLGVTTLLIVEAMKFKAFVVGMARGSLSTKGTTIMETVGAEVFSGLTCEISSQNDCT